MQPFFSQVFWSSLWSLPWTLSQINCLSPLHLVLLEFCLLTSFGTCSPIASFYLTCYFYFYVSGRLVTFLTLEKWPFVGDVPCIPPVHSLLVTRAICSRAVPYVDCVVLSVLWATVGCLIALVGPWSVWLPSCALFRGCCHWLAGLHHEAAACRTLGNPGASAVSLVGRFGVLEMLGMLPTH